jgi:hypothetical protein
MQQTPWRLYLAATCGFWLCLCTGGDLSFHGQDLSAHAQRIKNSEAGHARPALFLRLRGGRGSRNPEGAEGASTFLAQKPSPMRPMQKSGLEWSRSPADMSPGSRGSGFTCDGNSWTGEDDGGDLFSTISDASHIETVNTWDASKQGSTTDSAPGAKKDTNVFCRGDMLNEHNRVVGTLGCGAFGTVYATVSSHAGAQRCLAVKVQQGGKKYTRVRASAYCAHHRM